MLLWHFIVAAAVAAFGGFFFAVGYFGFAAFARLLRRIFRR